MNKICQYKYTRSNLFILSNRVDDLIVIQDVQFEFRQVLRHHYRLYGHLRSLLLPNEVTMNTFASNLPLASSR